MRISVSSILGVHSGLRLNNWDSGSEVQYSGFILGIQGLTCRVKMQQFGNQWVPSFDFRSLGSEKGGLLLSLLTLWPEASLLRVKLWDVNFRIGEESLGYEAFCILG